jgi:hypothetical protein
VNKGDKLWSQLIKQRAEGRCELCHGEGRDAHHIQGRSPQVLRWNLDNGIFLCFRCHRLGVHSPASETQAKFRDKIIFLRGEETMNNLAGLLYSSIKVTTAELKERIKEFKEMLQQTS